MKTVRVTFQHKSHTIQQSMPFEVFDSCTLETIQEEIPRKLSSRFGVREQDLIILGYFIISPINQEPYDRLNTLVEMIKGMYKTKETFKKFMGNLDRTMGNFYEDNKRELGFETVQTVQTVKDKTDREVNIEVKLSEDDLYDLWKNKQFDWTYHSKCGTTKVNVNLHHS